MMQEVFSLLADPEEGKFLAPLLARPTEDARQRYYDWLLTQSSPRAEVIRIVERLKNANSKQRKQLRSEFDEAVKRVPVAWWGLVKPVSWILNCGEAKSSERAIRFQYECPRQWEQLTPTNESNTRHCEECAQNVYYCENLGVAEARARAGECIAVSSQLASSLAGELTRNITGRPHIPELWANRIFDREK